MLRVPIWPRTPETRHSPMLSRARSGLCHGGEIVRDHRPQPDQHVPVLGVNVRGPVIRSSISVSMERASASSIVQPRRALRILHSLCSLALEMGGDRTVKVGEYDVRLPAL